jgi:hypothetical protein
LPNGVVHVSVLAVLQTIMATPTYADAAVPVHELEAQMAQNIEDIDASVPHSVADQPAHSSGPSSPTLLPQADEPLDASAQKKKKKKKPKKSAKSKEAANKSAAPSEQEPRHPVLCISRNKHWRYISSYHVRLTILLSSRHRAAYPSVNMTSRTCRVHGFNYPLSFSSRC